MKLIPSIRRALPVLVALGGLALGPAVRGQPTPGSADPTLEMFRALRPKVTFEVGEADINRLLTAGTAGFAIPAGFADPRVALRDGVVELSARKKVLFFATRVSVGMAPEIVGGRLRLPVRRVRASGLPLPTYFHKGVADGLTEMINGAVERNGLTLTGVTVSEGAVRVSAQVAGSGP